ncbi:MFS transporter [Kitasatospora viridis]|uniref:Putative MFS family arabinose efflux permease n=1 Tax=Kitasatospora viridis TaxID=281105 RepID=A0A561UMZ4_9ACTN|nr:MFS transporter [Kitasatospora viridis]TWG00730.1 putative MFS family arabinose efflux permease [Kitasatospora viridis]
MKVRILLTEVLGERSFRRQYLARAVSAFGTAMAPIGLSFAILDRGGSAADLGVVLTAGSIAMITLLLFAGVWADKYPRNRLMALADLVRVVSQGALAAAILAGWTNLWFIAATQVVSGAASGLFSPASSGLTVLTAKPSRLQESNSLLSTTNTALAAVGPLVAAVLIGTVGPGWCLAADAASFALSALFCSGIVLRPRPARQDGDAAEPGFLTELRQGWTEVSTRSWIWSTILACAAWQVLYSSFVVLGPAVAKQSFGGAGGWAAVLTAVSIGSALGGLLGFVWKPRRPMLVSTAVQVGLVPMVLLVAVRAPLVLVLLTALLAGIAQTYPDLLWKLTLQQHVPEEAMSRVSSYDWLGSVAMNPLSFVLAAALSSTFGVVTTLTGAAVMLVVVTALVLLVPSIRTIRRIETEEPTEEPTEDRAPGVPEPAGQSA